MFECQQIVSDSKTPCNGGEYTTKGPPSFWSISCAVFAHSWCGDIIQFRRSDQEFEAVRSWGMWHCAWTYVISVSPLQSGHQRAESLIEYIVVSHAIVSPSKDLSRTKKPSFVGNYPIDNRCMNSKIPQRRTSEDLISTEKSWLQTWVGLGKACYISHPFEAYRATSQEFS